MANAVALQTSNRAPEEETYKIGLMVQDVQSALLLRDEQALQTINLYGTDSRYYSMIRGWLYQELVAVESQFYATKDEKMRINFKFILIF